MSEHFYPKIESIKALEPYRLETIWNTGETLEVDVEKVLRTNASLHPLLEFDVFSQVHLDDWGCVEWENSELGADNVYAWAKEQAGQVSHEMFDEWMHRNGLSLATVAQVLGISQRTVNYYRTAQNPIPRQTWLACLEWEATRSDYSE